MLFEHPRERGQRASRLGSHPAFDEIDLQDSVHVAREIEDDSCPELLPAPTRPAPTGNQGDAAIRSVPEGGDHIIAMFRKDHPKWLDPIHAGPGAVEHPGHLVKPRVSLDEGIKIGSNRLQL